MSLIQKRPVVPPLTTDRNSLSDFAHIIQDNLLELHEAGHEHTVLTEDPATNDGMIQDIKIVDDGTTVKLAVKTARGWFVTAALTAL